MSYISSRSSNPARSLLFLAPFSIKSEGIAIIAPANVPEKLNPHQRIRLLR